MRVFSDRTIDGDYQALIGVDGEAEADEVKAWLTALGLSFTVERDEEFPDAQDIVTDPIKLGPKATMLATAWGEHRSNLLELQKHERAAVRAVSEIAKQYGVHVELKPPKGKHQAKVKLSKGDRNHTIIIAGSPRDKDHQLNYARQQARAACKALTSID